MDLLELNYITSCKRYSDIHEHLPILYKYACQVKHITELGVGPGNSTAAFMYARPKKFITYDILSSVSTFRKGNSSDSILLNLGSKYNKYTHYSLNWCYENQKEFNIKMEILNTDTWNALIYNDEEIGRAHV